MSARITLWRITHVDLLLQPFWDDEALVSVWSVRHPDSQMPTLQLSASVCYPYMFPGLSDNFLLSTLSSSCASGARIAGLLVQDNYHHAQAFPLQTSKGSMQ